MSKLKKCPYCNINLSDVKNVGSHIKWCKKNPKRQQYLDKLKETRKKYKLTGSKLIERNNKIKIAWKDGKYDNVNHVSFKGKKHTEETKRKISESRKKYLSNNPDKHVWKYNNKFISKPCEILKLKLKENNISFIEEYSISNDRFYSIDIAFPNKKIGIEINGNQHYRKDGKLKKYYQDRHNYFNDNNWTLYEIHYKSIFINNELNDIINKIKDFSLTQYELDIYKNENILNKKRIKFCLDCGKEIYKTSIRCKKCDEISRRKVERPTQDQLIKDIEELGYCGTGRKYGVSDSAIKKWKIKYENIK